MTDKERIEKAVDIASNFAYIDGGHHKNWVINEMISALITPEERAKTGWDEPDWLEECMAP